MVAWAAIAQAAATAAPSVMKAFGPGKNQHVDKDPNFGFKKLVRVAQQNGFNPLTALRATGGAGGAPAQAQSPQLSSLDFVADALGRGVETYYNAINADKDEEADRLRVEIMREQLEQMRAEKAAPSARGSFGYDVPTAVTTTLAVRDQPPALASAIAVPTAISTSPLSEIRPDGSTGANRDNPAEFEADIWDAALRGKAPPYLRKVAADNLFPGANLPDWSFGSPMQWVLKSARTTGMRIRNESLGRKAATAKVQKHYGDDRMSFMRDFYPTVYD